MKRCVIPTDKPIGSVSVKSVPGWTITAEKTKLPTPLQSGDSTITEAVSKITWTADAASAIKPGQFQGFDGSAGPLPETDQIAFKALQTNSDGDVVRWIEVPTAGQAEPNHPAPVLKLTPKTAASASASTGMTVTATDSDDNGAPLGLTIAAPAVAALALIVSLLGIRRKQTTSS
ncbi:YcnI family protein [Hamadaea sp. NPDC051192]|uniref:YcnI family copper-binding membrane protein n=1 Tax=Hamadaea sp. NPDC051192 TaxID=3154940 RepID=UPI003420E8DF